MRKATYSLFLAVVASALLLPVLASQHEPIGDRDAVRMRAVIAATSAVNPSGETSAVQTTQATTATPASPSTTQAAGSSSQQATSATPTSQATATTSHTSSESSNKPVGVTTTAVAATTTDASGQVITSLIVSTAALPSASASHTQAASDSGGGGLSTGSIVGLSVSGGIAAIAIILFFVWKFTRKRFTDFDNEAIKWPELNAHNNDVHALPTNSTGRAGFGPENDSDMNLVRAPSPPGAYANSIAASSVPEVYGTGDPYAVPPLPHLNPNQPYHDEPGTYGQPAGYYDPYRGPVPNTFTDPVSDVHGAESIPMTQMARMRSPAPQVAYDMQGRGSPAPQAAMGYAGADERSRTPVPGALGTGRASPISHPGYGYGPR